MYKTKGPPYNLWTRSNSTLKANSRGKDYPSLIRTNLAISLVNEGSQQY